MSTGTRSLISLHMTASSWVTGYGVRGLASPHPFLGATPLACSKSGPGECGLLPGAFRRRRHGVWLVSSGCWASVVPASSGLQFVVATWGEVSSFRLLCGERVPSSAVFLPWLWTSLYLCSSSSSSPSSSSTRCLSLSSSTEWWFFSVASQRQGSQCKLCILVIPQCSSLRGS